MGPGEAEGEAQREASAPAGAREGVTLEDVAVRFSAEEWALLEGWQKALHREVMQENVTLLLSLGHSVPTEALPSLIRETLEDQVLGSSGDGRSDAEGGEPPFAEEAAEAEGPWELDCLSDQEEGGLAPGRRSKGDRQSSLHLCALMKLVKEIPEFLYGHGKAGGDSSGCSEPGPPAEEQPPQVKEEAHLENLHRSSLEADLAEVSPGLSSHPGTPASSAEGDWAEPPSGGLHGHDESRSLPSCEGHTEAGAERTPPAPARDSPSSKTAGVTDLQRAKSGVGKGLPKETDLRGPEHDASRPGRPSSSGSPAAAPLDCLSPQGGLHTNAESPVDPDRQASPSPRMEAGATGPHSLGALCGISLSSNRATGDTLLPETACKRVCREGVATHVSSPNPAQATTEEKPLQGLLKSLRELIGHQPPVTCRASTSDWLRRRDVGSGSPPKPVKTEAADEDPPLHSQINSKRDGADSSARPGGSRLPTFWPTGGRRGCTREAQAPRPLVAVKLEGETSGSPLQCLQRMANPTSSPRGSAAKEGTAAEPGGLRVMVKTELPAEEEMPLQGVQELPKGYHHRHPLPRIPSPRDTEAGVEEGPWVPYAEAEWRPVTSPLHGLLNCLKEIPTPGPHPANILASKRGGEGGGRERRKGGRRGKAGLGIPLQGLERHLKEVRPNSRSQPCSPVVSSSIGSSPDQLFRWTPETGRWLQKEEEGLTRNGPPSQGPGRGSPNRHSQPRSPAVSSSISSSPDGLHRWTLEPGKGTRKEEGARPPRVSPLEGLENCLKEIPVSRSPCPAAAPAPDSFSSQKRKRAGATSPGSWPGGDPADSFLQLPTSTSGSTDAEASVGKSPLLRLMSCLQGIPIQRPSYLDTLSGSSSSSSCSEAEREQPSPGGGAWWSPDMCQGSEVEVAVDSGRGRSPATALSSDKERCPSTPEPEPREEAEHRVAASAPVRGLENCLKDMAGSRLCGVRISSASTHSHRGTPALRGDEAGVHGSCPDGSPHTHRKDPPAGALDLAGHHSERGTERSHLEVQVASPHAEEGVTETSPLQGLLRCLQEITSGGPGPPSSAASDTQGEARPTCAKEEEEADLRRTSQEGLGSCLKERPRSRASPAAACLSSPGREKARQSPPSGVDGGHRGDFSPVCGVGICAIGVAGNGHLHLPSQGAPVPKLGNRRWSDSSPPKSGSKRSLVTVRTEDPQAMPCSFGSQGNGLNHETPAKKRCPTLELPLPSCGWGQGKSPEGPEGLGGLGPALSQKLDRLSTDMSTLCRDVSRLQSHMDRLEQDARGWVLELAALRMENQGLSKYVRRMESRCRTLENRSRRNNLRLLGLPEGMEGSDAMSFLQKTLPAMLGLPRDVLEIESARRVPGGVSWDPNGRPRPLVFRLLRFANKATILQAARRQPLSYAGTRVTVLPDFCSSLVQRRRVPFGAVRRTRWAADLCFGLRHSSCSCAWTRAPRGLLTCSGPLAGVREGRGPKGHTGTGNWGTGTLESLGPLGGGPSTSGLEQHMPTTK